MKKISTATTETEYVLGTDRDELWRLGLQHQLWAEQTARAWERAGFALGQHILDLGCGPGYATFDLANRVGAAGKVFAVDQSQRFLGYLRSQIQARGVTNIFPSLGDVERLDLPARTLHGAYARWVLCFVKRPATVIYGVARSLRRGGVFVIHDYYNYEAILVAPQCAIFKKVFHLIAESWRLHGGNPDVGCDVPGLLRRGGFEVKEVNALVRAARPGSTLWNWPDSFFKIYLPTLVEMKLITGSEKKSFLREWAKRSRDPAAFFTTPPMLEIIAVKK